MPKRALHANAKNASKEVNTPKDTGEAFGAVRDASLLAKMAAWGLIVGTLLIIMVSARCVLTYGGDDTPNPFPVARTTPAPVAGDPSGDLFPDAPMLAPIITGVDCPDGAIQIATGPGRPVDTVCVRGQIVDRFTDASSVTVTPTPGPGPGMTWGMVCTGPGVCVGPLFRPCVEDELELATGECIQVEGIGEGGR